MNRKAIYRRRSLRARWGVIPHVGREDRLLLIDGQLVADLRPLLHDILLERGMQHPLCCHPYDLCTILIAEELGLAITGPTGAPLDKLADNLGGGRMAFVVVAVSVAVNPENAAQLTVRELRPDDLAALVIREAVSRAGVPVEQIEPLVAAVMAQARAWTRGLVERGDGVRDHDPCRRSGRWRGSPGSHSG